MMADRTRMKARSWAHFWIWRNSSPSINKRERIYYGSYLGEEWPDWDWIPSAEFAIEKFTGLFIHQPRPWVVPSCDLNVKFSELGIFAILVTLDITSCSRYSFGVLLTNLALLFPVMKSRNLVFKKLAIFHPQAAFFLIRSIRWRNLERNLWCLVSMVGYQMKELYELA